MHRVTRLLSAMLCLLLLCSASFADTHVQRRPFLAPSETALSEAVRADMDFLAADEMRGRGSMTRDEHLAALYCASVFESVGLQPGGDHGTFLQQIPVELDARATKRLSRFETVPRTSTWNAVAILPGSDPTLKNEVVLLTAHLDHLGVAAEPVHGDSIYNGADDDASGTTAVLNLARSLARSRPPLRTVVFALFGSEEVGGYGAKGFLDHPPVPLPSVVANLEFEMIGRPDPAVPEGTLWLTGYERSNLGPTLARHGAHLLPDPHPAQHFFERSDNIALARRGTIAQTVSSFGLHTDYHQVSDELKTIDFVHMIQAIQNMEAPVRWLANTGWKPAWNSGGQPAPASQSG